MSLHVDRASWVPTRFGDVVTNINDYFSAERDGTLPYVAGPHIAPGQPAVTSYGSTDDDDFPPTFKRKFRSGDVLLHSRGIEKLAVVDRPGVTGEKLFVLRSIDEGRLLQDFLPWLLMGPLAQRHMKDNFTGSVNKFLNWRPLAGFDFDLPPLDQQRRIADLLQAFEQQRRALDVEADESRRLAAVLTMERLDELQLKKRLGDLATTRSGPSYAASDVHDRQVEGAVPMLGITNTKPDGKVDLDGAGYVTGLANTVGRIDDSSLILIRTNGNRQRIGNVYLPPDEARGFAVSAFQFLMQVNDPSDRAFLYCVLNEPRMQQRMSEGASGSVGLGNLAVRWLNEQDIPWSTHSNDRAAVVEEVGLLANAVESIRRQSAALTQLRSRVLADILGGH